MTAAYLAALWALAGAEAAESPHQSVEDHAEQAQQALDTAQPTAEGLVDGGVDVAESPSPVKRPRRSRRTLIDVGLCPDPADPWCREADHQPVGPRIKRPQILLPRRPAGAAALGILVGLGTGFYYAGDSTMGLAFTIVDVSLAASLTGSIIAFNQLVVRNDFRSGKSLKRGERQFGGRESNLFAVTWVLVGLMVASHTYQGVAGVFAARKTNAQLDQFTFVPTPTGASGAITMRW